MSAVALVAAAVGTRFPRFSLAVVLVEAAAAVLLILAFDTPPTHVYLLVPPMVAGFTLGLMSALAATGVQALLLLGGFLFANPPTVDAGLGAWCVTGLVLGVVAAGVGHSVSREVRRYGAAAAYEERRRLAADIHDGLGQDLAVIGYQLDRLLLSESDRVPSERVETIRAEVRRTLYTTRWAIHDLRGGRLPEAGLGPALADHVRRAADLCGLTAHLSITTGERWLPVSVETELLRIGQEAVTNVRKHARAQNLWVTLELSGGTALLVVSDDGVSRESGTDVDLPTGFGIGIMQERARAIDAEFEIRARTGGGTVVTVRLVDRPAPLPTMGKVLKGAIRGRSELRSGSVEIFDDYQGVGQWV